MSKSIPRGKTQKKQKNHFPYEIAIPSYDRPETLRDKTLTLLKAYRIPTEKITIFLANDEQLDIYKRILHKETYGKLVVGIKGLMNVRNFISDYYPIGTPLVCFDDDLKGFLEYTETTPRKERPLRSLLAIIKRGFEECKKSNASFWGLYPVPNGFFMKPTVSTDLKFCIGSAWGCINPGTKGPKGVKLTMSEKEDYERTILYFLRDDAVVRLNFVSPITAYYKEPGGMQEENRKEKQKIAVAQLLKRYPDFVKENPKRKSGYPEIRLRTVKSKVSNTHEDSKSDMEMES